MCSLPTDQNKIGMFISFTSGLRWYQNQYLLEWHLVDLKALSSFSNFGQEKMGYVLLPPKSSPIPAHIHK